MASLTVVLNSNQLDATMLANKFDQNNKHKVMRLLGAYLQGIVSGNKRAYVTTQVASAYASGTVTCTQSAAVDATDTVTVCGTALSVVASPSTTAQFAKGASDAAMATNLANCINANATLQKIVRASASAAVVTVTCKIPGPIGNLCTLAETGNGMSVSGTNFTAGASDEADHFAFGYDATV